MTFWHQLTGMQREFPDDRVATFADHNGPGNLREFSSVLRRLHIEPIITLRHPQPYEPSWGGLGRSDSFRQLCLQRAASRMYNFPWSNVPSSTYLKNTTVRWATSQRRSAQRRAASADVLSLSRPEQRSFVASRRLERSAYYDG